MRTRGTAALGLGLWIAACQQPIEPEEVKKVEQCVALFKQGLDEAGAKKAARNLIEEAALVEEAVDAICRCHEQAPPEAAHRDVLVVELLSWIKEWDNQGRPKYLAQ